MFNCYEMETLAGERQREIQREFLHRALVAQARHGKPRRMFARWLTQHLVPRQLRPHRRASSVRPA